MRSMHEYDEVTKALAAAIVAHALTRIGNDRPPVLPASPVELGRRASRTITAGGLGGEEALRIWAEILAPSTLSMDHPAFLALVPGVPTKASVLFDLVARHFRSKGEREVAPCEPET